MPVSLRAATRCVAGTLGEEELDQLSPTVHGNVPQEGLGVILHRSGRGMERGCNLDRRQPEQNGLRSPILPEASPNS